MTVTLDQAVKVGGLLLALAGLYYGQKAQTDRLADRLSLVVGEQKTLSLQLEGVEKTTQEIYWSLKAQGVLK